MHIINFYFYTTQHTHTMTSSNYVNLSEIARKKSIVSKKTVTTIGISQDDVSGRTIFLPFPSDVLPFTFVRLITRPEYLKQMSIEFNGKFCYSSHLDINLLQLLGQKKEDGTVRVDLTPFVTKKYPNIIDNSTCTERVHFSLTHSPSDDLLKNTFLEFEMQYAPMPPPKYKSPSKIIHTVSRCFGNSHFGSVFELSKDMITQAIIITSQKPLKSIDIYESNNGEMLCNFDANELEVKSDDNELNICASATKDHVYAISFEKDMWYRDQHGLNAIGPAIKYSLSCKVADCGHDENIKTHIIGIRRKE